MLFNTGLLINVPPVAALYHTTVYPEGTLAVAVSVGTGAGEQKVCTWSPPDTGDAVPLLLTVTANMAAGVWQEPALANTLTLPLELPKG